MGGVDFRARTRGATAEEAFRAAVERARHERGHGGSTGTVAEKDGFVVKRPRPGETVEQLVERTLDDNEKWGPAFCVPSRRASARSRSARSNRWSGSACSATPTPGPGSGRRSTSSLQQHIAARTLGFQIRQQH